METTKMKSETDERDGLGSKIGTFLRHGLARGGKEAAEAQRNLEHSLGLGQKPNSVPAGAANMNGEPRTIELGWHPVAGATGKWFAEKTKIGQAITKKIGKYPDPTQHWAVIVGDHVHELWMDEKLDIIYMNEKLKREEWHTFEVGKTKFNDQALKKAGQVTIHTMSTPTPAYHLISNNCQNFAVNLLDKVQLGAHREFATAAAVYQRATGDGEIDDLFAGQQPEEQQNLQVDEEEMSKPHRQNTVQVAQQVMAENTTHLDDDHD